jgi:hypothetical protein
MRVDVARVPTARERAAAVTRPERAPEGRRHRALLAADVERRAVCVLDDRDQAAVASEALGRTEPRASSAAMEVSRGVVIDSCYCIQLSAVFQFIVLMLRAFCEYSDIRNRPEVAAAETSNWLLSI